MKGHKSANGNKNAHYNGNHKLGKMPKGHHRANRQVKKVVASHRAK